MSLLPDIFQMGVRWIAISISNDYEEAVAAGFSLHQRTLNLKVAATFFRDSKARGEYILKRRTQWEVL